MRVTPLVNLQVWFCIDRCLRWFSGPRSMGLPIGSTVSYQVGGATLGAIRDCEVGVTVPGRRRGPRADLSRENTLVMAIEKRSAEKTLSAPTEKCPTEGGIESSTKRKKRMAKKAEKGTSSRGDGRGSTPERDRAKAKEPTKVAKPAKNPEGPCCHHEGTLQDGGSSR
ncbi:hypothetical protein GW17_00015421 [Ensete ventricosum]|nr:hypothetical protein GW17_00015421 [Ensete ventricosum]